MVKKRDTRQTIKVGNYLNSSGQSNGTNLFATYGNVEKLLVSESHDWPNGRLVHGIPTRDVGGPFLVQKVSYRPSWTRVRIPRDTGIGNVGYEGLISAEPANVSYSGISPKTEPQMQNFAVSAWQKFKPTNPQGNLGQFLGELERLPISRKNIEDISAMAKDLKGFAKSRTNKDMADLYLQYEFGIRPYISDIQQIAETILNFDKVVKQLARDSGRAIRRSGGVSSSTVTTESVITGNSSTQYIVPRFMNVTVMEGATKLYVTTQTTTKVWFSAQFRYWLDDGGANPLSKSWKFLTQSQERQLLRLTLGADFLDPVTWWELVPFTFLIDYVVPIGDWIDRTVNDVEDGLVADYAYIMCSVKETNRYRVVAKGASDNKAYEARSVIIRETKQRSPVLPFGPGSDLNVTDKRKAILAALFTSKAHKYGNFGADKRRGW